jgi:hypothetical protein
MSSIPKKITIVWSPAGDARAKFERLFDPLALRDEIFLVGKDDHPEQQAGLLAKSPIEVG